MAKVDMPSDSIITLGKQAINSAYICPQLYTPPPLFFWCSQLSNVVIRFINFSGPLSALIQKLWHKSSNSLSWHQLLSSGTFISYSSPVHITSASCASWQQGSVNRPAVCLKHKWTALVWASVMNHQSLATTVFLLHPPHPKNWSAFSAMFTSN